MASSSFVRVADRSDWKESLQSQYETSQIVYKDKNRWDFTPLLINEHNQEVSGEYGGQQFRVLAILLKDRSLAATILRVALGIILVAASLGFSLCFEGGRNLFSRKFAVVISQRFDEGITHIESLTVVGESDSKERNLSSEPLGSPLYEVDFKRINYGIPENFVGAKMSAVMIRDIMERIPEEDFHGDRSVFQTVKATVIQNLIREALRDC